MAKKKGPPASPFVPTEEQPYPIPENWCWTRIGVLSSLHRGVSYKKNDAHDIKETDDCLVMRGGNIGEGYIVTNTDNVYVNKSLVDESQLVRQNDIIIVASTGSTKVIGRAGVSTIDYEDVSFGAFLMLIRPIDKSDPKYVGFFFQSNDYRNQIRNLASGVNINNIRADYITEMPIPLPPLPEQHRIVDRIERLFAKLDEAKEKAQAVVNSFELRKSAILHKAFTGELTERWRKEHGVGLDSWKRCLLGEVFDLQAGKNISAKEISVQKTDLYRYPCFGGNGIRGYVEQFNREGEHPIIGRQGALCGNINLANNQFYATEHAVVVSYKMDVSTSWAYYYLKFLNLNQYATATAQPGLAVSTIVKVPVQYVPFEEQQELSRFLDDLLNKEQRAKEAAEAVLSHIDTMKKAILARAFRGELGTNDPAEESASKLIKSVLCSEESKN